MKQTNVMTLADIVGTESLDVKTLAGGNGLAREVLWAHSCEMVDPAQWLGPHELLMTIGLCVPRDPHEQASFIGRLDDAGLAGMMLGDHEPAPPLSPEMFEEADRRAFPILLAGTRTPYAVIARHVAAANSSAQTMQVLKLSKLYHLAAYADDDAHSLMQNLVSLLGVGLYIEETTTGLTLLAADHPHSAAPKLTVRRYRLRGTHPAELVVSEYPGEELDSFLLVHLMKVLEVNVHRILDAADRRAEVSARLMLALLNGTPLPETSAFLAPHMPSDGFQLIALPASEGSAVDRALAINRLPVIAGAGRDEHLALVPVNVVSAFRQLIQSVASRVGASSVFIDYVDTRIAAVEASKVLTAAQHSDRFWTDFEGTTISVLSRSHREAAEIVTGILAGLAGDASRARSLRETLFAYLRNDRKWKETASELGIHRQTLSYRLNKIEEETGLSLSRTGDVSALWIAYQAWDAIHG